MAINIPDEEIREIVKEEVDKSVRKRIREMQGDYTSKGYLENLITKVLWDKIICEIPDLEDYIKSEIHEYINFKKNNSPKITKRELINSVIDAFLEREYDE